MSASAAVILGNLKVVEAERERRSADPALNAKVLALKAYQQRRFSHTYTDLLASARYGAASRFFLDELYGPSDFTRRDSQFARMVPGLARFFPDEIVQTVATLAELHALSETFDTAMGRQLDDERIAPVDYIRAWQQTDRAPDREHQIALTLEIASSLDRLTRKPLLRRSLHFMRGPARIAGLYELHHTLEIGFDTFHAMNGAQEFIAIIGSRERELAAALFAVGVADTDPASMKRALASLP